MFMKIIIKSVIVFFTLTDCVLPSEHPPVMGEKCQNV